MKNLKGTMLVCAVLMMPLLTGLASSLNTNEKIQYASSPSGAQLMAEDDIVITISKAPGLLGFNLEVTNQGAVEITDVLYTMRTKAAITGTGIFINELVQNGTIETIQADETIIIPFRPISQETKSPFGLGNLYMDVELEVDAVTIRTQQRSLLFFFLILGYRDTYMDISPATAYDKYLNEDFDLIIDVVGLDIYQNGHLPGAVNYVWADGTLQDMISSLDVDGTYLVYCHTDPPSTASAQALVDAGITNTYRLEGNYAAWVSAGYPVET